MTAHQVALDALPFGPSKRSLCGRDTCPCGSGAHETPVHTFATCTRSRLLWFYVLRAWRTVTGETKVRETDIKLIIFGSRDHTWLDEHEQGEWAGLEAPFAILHKVTIQTILDERNRDAQPRRPCRRTPSQLYQRVQCLVQRIAEDAWRMALRQSCHDGGAAAQKFRKQWEAPGLATIDESNTMRVIVFMREETRNRWCKGVDSLRSRHYRNQAFAPPVQLPDGTVSIYTDGSAVPRKIGQPLEPAGYGFVVATGGSGHEHKGGHEVYRRCGQITARTKNVTTTTNNLAELLAFTRALQWACYHPSTAVVLRYDSTYAAMIASGTWKARKHKAMAAEARRAWAALKHAHARTLWLRHVRGHSGNYWNTIADRLADQGRHGLSHGLAVD